MRLKIRKTKTIEKDYITENLITSNKKHFIGFHASAAQYVALLTSNHTNGFIKKNIVFWDHKR